MRAGRRSSSPTASRRSPSRRDRRARGRAIVARGVHDDLQRRTTSIARSTSTASSTASSRKRSHEVTSRLSLMLARSQVEDCRGRDERGLTPSTGARPTRRTALAIVSLLGRRRSRCAATRRRTVDRVQRATHTCSLVVVAFSGSRARDRLHVCQTIHGWTAKDARRTCATCCSVIGSGSRSVFYDATARRDHQPPDNDVEALDQL